MQKFHFLNLILFIVVAITMNKNAVACSGYKITVGNKTLFGSNEDAWRLTPHIWFENGVGRGDLNAAFTGSRMDGENGYAPQAGMNEMGLAFERLSSYHPLSQNFTNRKPITNPTQYLKDILHACKTVDEVHEFISKYDHSYFIEDVFIYVDKSGKYLIVEPYKLTIGTDPTYVISNFCPSITSKLKANKLDRYRNGVAFLKSNPEATLKFCSALSDTMHVCREKNGDGTLLTSIWDLNNGTVNLYFYHSYQQTVQFNLEEEFKKGNHILSIESLFPFNAEFEQLRNFKTPKNSLLIGLFLLGSAGLFVFSSVFFLIRYFRKKQVTKYANIQLVLFTLGLMLTYYMYVLCGSVSVFYFSAPYKDPTHVLVSLSSYIPFLLLVLIVPFYVLNVYIFKEKSWSNFAKGLVTLNNLVYTVLIGLFVYWKFYDVFG